MRGARPTMNFSMKKFNFLYSLAAIALMWAVWMIAAAAVKNEFLIAPVGSSVRQFFKLFAEPFFWRVLGHTLARTVAAYLISFAAALGCACLAVAFKPFAAFMRPITAFFRTLPTMAVLLLLLVWLTPRTAPVAVALLVLFPMTYSQLSEAIGGVDGELLQMAKVYGLPVRRRIANIYIPHLAPLALAQTGANLSFGLKLIISAEVMASTRTALGGMISEAQAYINLPRIAALTLVAVALGILIEFVFRAVANKAFSWKRAVNID